MNDSSSGRQVVRLRTRHCVRQGTAIKRRSMCWAVELTFGKPGSAGGGRRAEAERPDAVRCLAREPGGRRELRQLKNILDFSLAHAVRTAD